MLNWQGCGGHNANQRRIGRAGQHGNRGAPIGIRDAIQGLRTVHQHHGCVLSEGKEGAQGGIIVLKPSRQSGKAADQPVNPEGRALLDFFPYNLSPRFFTS